MATSEQPDGEQHECPTCGRAFDGERGLKTHRSMMGCGDAPWRDAETMERLYVAQELSGSQIAERFGCAQATVLRWLERHGIERRDPDPPEPSPAAPELRNQNWLREQYSVQERTTYEIADQLGCSYSAVVNALDRFDIPRRGSPEGPRIPELGDGDWLREQYVEQEWSTLKIADELGCSSTGVAAALRRHGIDLRESGDPLTAEALTDPDRLRVLYEEEGLTMRKIAQKVGCSQKAVGDYLHRHGIEVRQREDYGYPTGKDHPRHAGGRADYYGSNWPEQRRRALLRDQARCRVCGMTDAEHVAEYGHRLHVHHITPIREYREDGVLDHEAANALTNLRTLCRDHHVEAERIAPLYPFDD